MERVQIPCSSLDIPALHVVFWPIAWHCFTVLMAHDGPLFCDLFCLFLGSCIKLTNPQRLCKHLGPSQQTYHKFEPTSCQGSCTTIFPSHGTHLFPQHMQRSAGKLISRLGLIPPGLPRCAKYANMMVNVGMIQERYVRLCASKKVKVRWLGEIAAP